MDPSQYFGKVIEHLSGLMLVTEWDPTYLGFEDKSFLNLERNNNTELANHLIEQGAVRRPVTNGHEEDNEERDGIEP